MTRTAAETVATLRNGILAALRPLLAGAPTVALLEYPEYPNPGDSAIWLGTLALLRTLGVPDPVYTTEERAHDAHEMATRLGDGIVLLQGGGSFGDLWPTMQAFREAVVAGAPTNRVVQLPQSVHFEHPDGLARARAVFGAHPDLTFLARDESSAVAARGLGVAVGRCPDLALLLDLPPAPPTAPHEVVWLGRGDHEAARAAAPPAVLPPAVEVVDWTSPPRTAWYRRLSRRSRRLRRARRPSRRRRDRLMAAYEPVARERVAHATSVLDRGRVVVTDRLHGHILCLLRGQPHVLLDNSYGKVRRFHEAWTRDVEGTRFAASGEEALDLARDLLRRAVGA